MLRYDTGGCLRCDVQSVSAYSDEQGEMSYGYNPDPEKQTQVILGLFTTRRHGLPLAYKIYYGSICDFANLEHTAAWAENTGLPADFTQVTDGNFSAGSDEARTACACRTLIAAVPLDHGPGVKEEIFRCRRSGKVSPFFIIMTL